MREQFQGLAQFAWKNDRNTRSSRVGKLGLLLDTANSPAAKRVVRGLEHIQRQLQARVHQLALRNLCPQCSQPVLPKGVEKQPDWYNHAQGCPNDK